MMDYTEFARPCFMSPPDLPNTLPSTRVCVCGKNPVLQSCCRHPKAQYLSNGLVVQHPSSSPQSVAHTAFCIAGAG
jgi:hypothetical protein